MTPNLLATLTLFTNRRAAFRVTPKGRTGGGRHGAHVPPLLTAMLVLSVVAIGVVRGDPPGVDAGHLRVPWAVHAAFVWMLVNVGLVWLAIRRIRATRYAAERRSSVRFATDIPGRVDGIETWVRDLSLTGARLEVPDAAVIAPTGRLVVEAGGGRPIVLDGVARTTWTDRSRPDDGGLRVRRGPVPGAGTSGAGPVRRQDDRGAAAHRGSPRGRQGPGPRRHARRPRRGVVRRLIRGPDRSAWTVRAGRPAGADDAAATPSVRRCASQEVPACPKTAAKRDVRSTPTT